MRCQPVGKKLWDDLSAFVNAAFFPPGIGVQIVGAGGAGVPLGPAIDNLAEFATLGGKNRCGGCKGWLFSKIAFFSTTFVRR
jgi:hypothetical protein